MKKIILLSLGLAVPLVACESQELRRTAEPNQELRQKLFQECLKNLPAGPDSTKYNDWSEVVDSCAQAAYYQSLEDGYWKGTVWVKIK